MRHHDLSENNVIDLRGINEEVLLHGVNSDLQTVIIKNATRKSRIKAMPGTCIIGHRGTFVLKLIDCEHLYLQSENLFIHGGVQVVGDIGCLDLTGVHQRGGDVGLHMTQHNGTEVYESVSLKDCSFNDNDHEGIYIGKSNEGDYPKIKSIFLSAVQTIGNGWDGGQFAQAERVKLVRSIFLQNGLIKQPWQDKDLTINPGCGRVDIEECVVGGEIQLSNPDKVFFHATVK